MKYNKETCALEISAHELCSLALRTGDMGGIPLASDALARDDRELYYRIQSEAGAYYNPDVELYNTISLDGIYFTVSAVADGIIRKPSGLVVDTIKCVRGKAFYRQPDAFTLGLLKCSAYFACVRDGLEAVDGRVSYYNVGTKKLKYFNYRFLASELGEFYLYMLERIKYRAQIAVEREQNDRPSAENAVFPYTELREGQESMIRESFLAFKNGERLFVEAPTGTGKTISALFPAVRALGRGLCDKIFYLTAKTSTGKEAFSAVSKLHKAGVMMRTVMLSAKEQMCPYSRTSPAGSAACGSRSRCRSERCELLRGYYDRVDGALREILGSYRGYSRSFIYEIALKHRVCPYELSLDLSELCDVVICDYNYAFDPHVYLRRYFGQNALDAGAGYVFLIDEAHNLADRARDMYSAELKLSDVERVLTMIAPDDNAAAEISELLTPVIRDIKRIKRLCREDTVKDENGEERGFYVASEPPEPVSRSLSALAKGIDVWSFKNELHPLAESILALRSDVGRYLRICDFFDRNFKFYATIANGDIVLRLYCLDPSEIMNTLLTRARASVMFSATLTPTDYFCDVLGGGKKARKLSLPSPFPSENLCVVVADWINTRLDVREDNAKRFATLIAATVSARAGNYIAYFPSYQCLEQTHKMFTRKYPRVETVVQKKHMSIGEREEFLSAFKDDTGHLRVGFCVLGGVFSEGVDLPGSRLIGSVVFGVGLPGLSNEKNIVKEHFDLKSDEGIGYDYAYTFPGMNNVLQAAGRVIRRDDDRGVVVLADDRYATPKYTTLFPKHWRGIKCAGNASSVAEIMRRFWENQL